jgi:hypothetical protein
MLNQRRQARRRENIAADKVARIYSCIPADIRKLDKLCAERSDAFTFVKEDKWGGRYYETAAKNVKFQAPRILSEERLEALREHGKRLAGSASQSQDE